MPVISKNVLECDWLLPISNNLRSDQAVLGSHLNLLLWHYLRDSLSSVVGPRSNNYLPLAIYYKAVQLF